MLLAFLSSFKESKLRFKVIAISFCTLRTSSINDLLFTSVNCKRLSSCFILNCALFTSILLELK